jgi:hypothetical protein
MDGVIRPWVDLSMTVQRRFPVVAVPFFQEHLYEQCYRYASEEAAITSVAFARIALLTSYFLSDRSHLDQVMPFIEILLQKAALNKPDLSNDTFSYFGHLVLVYRFPPYFVAQVLGFFREWTEMAMDTKLLAGMYDRASWALTLFIVANGMVADVDVVMPIWIECLDSDLEAEKQGVDLEDVIHFLIVQLSITVWLTKLIDALAVLKVPMGGGASRTMAEELQLLMPNIESHEALFDALGIH